ncbi:hypothetical protein [Sulfurimonas sp.]|jgi:hypothetical protein|uniref:hypothetical protein n=1 Tax=Sulfurimonas sp. TaxID=2022749 RepID=UPI002A364E2B|nr:hypothetical protein [Sulfurimonas sp.]MDY0124151.1 hypothetical protein [Sulfurimonas sp.]
MSIKSLIATILIAPLFVGFVLLQIEYSYFSKESNTSVIQKPEKLDINTKISNNTEKPRQLNEESFIEPDLGNLQTLFEIAGKIYGSTERDNEYIKIIALAIAEEKPGFAYEVAQNIYGSGVRNSQYVHIIDKCLIMQKYTLATKVAEKIYGSTKRNQEYKKIIEASKDAREIQASNKSEELIKNPRAAF